MNVNSELIEAQLEVLEGDPATPVKGRVWQLNNVAPIKVHDGAQVHKVLTDKMFPEIKSANFPTGVTPSDLNAGFTLPQRKIVSNFVISESSGLANIGSTYADVQGLSVTITTFGNPVELSLVGGIFTITGTSGGVNGTVKFLKNNSDIVTGSFDMGLSVSLSGNTQSALSSTSAHTHGLSTASVGLVAKIPSGSVRLIDYVPAGTYTYKIQARTYSGSMGAEFIRLMAREL